MEGSEIILSLDYAVDDELKDEGHEDEDTQVKPEETANSVETKEEPDSEKTPAKSKPSEETVNGGTETKSTPKAVSEKKSQSKTKAKTPVSSTNGKKEASSSASKSKSSTTTSTTSSSPTENKVSKENVKSKEEKPTEYKLYVSGINEETKASDLQDLFTKQCKILDAKIIRFSKIPNQCFGLVTFDSASLVKKCMDSLNKTSLKGNTIVLSQSSPLKTPSSKSNTNSSNTKSETDKSTKKEESKAKEESAQSSKSSSKKEPSKDTKSQTPKTQKTNGSKESASKKPESKSSTKPASKAISTKESSSSAKKDVKKNDKSDKDSKDKKKEKSSNDKEKQKEKEKPRVRPKERERRRSRSRSRSASPRSRRAPRRPISIRRSPPIRRDSFQQSRLERLKEIRQREELDRMEHERMRFQREKERLQLERLKLEREKLEILQLERERISKEREEVARRRQMVEEQQRVKRVEYIAPKRAFESSRDEGHGRSPPVPFHPPSRRDEPPYHSRTFVEPSSRFESRDARSNLKRSKYNDNGIDYDQHRPSESSRRPHSSNDRDERKDIRRDSRDERRGGGGGGGGSGSFEDSRRGDHRYPEKDNSNGMVDSPRVFGASAPDSRSNWPSAPVPANQWTTSATDRWTSSFDSNHAQSALSPPIMPNSVSSMTDIFSSSSNGYSGLPLGGMSSSSSYMHPTRRF